MSEIAKFIDDVIRRDLAKRLRSEGYRKSGRTFYSANDTRTAVVNVQASRNNFGDSGTFTINCGVYFPDVASITKAIPFTGRFPKEHNCTIRERIGRLMDGNDFWWPINSNTDFSSLAKDVANTWALSGKPWIDRVSELDAAHTELVGQHQYFVAAGISVLSGRRDEAIQLVHKAVDRKPRAAGRIQDWARQHELI